MHTHIHTPVQKYKTILKNEEKDIVYNYENQIYERNGYETFKFNLKF